MKDGLYARMHTSKGEILLSLTYDKTPGTVGNFVALAEGNQKNSHRKPGTAYYDGLKFHRVIADFMIQGGCPLGTGTGNPGYQFDDEFHPELKHDTPGKLSMANAGPGTNGSQFFITHTATPWLDGKHTVFGEVVEGQKVVDTIAQNDVIEKIEIVRVGQQAQAFNAIAAFEQFNNEKAARLEKEKKAQEALLQEITKGFTRTDSGLYYQITDPGTGPKPTRGQKVAVHYRGSLLNGQIFDSSFERGQPITFAVGTGQVIPGWDEGILLLSEGDKAAFIIPPQLAYGSQGAGGVIPPNASLIFEVELVKVN